MKAALAILATLTIVFAGWNYLAQQSVASAAQHYMTQGK